MKAMIFAAGKGTRLRPLTDSIPKALVKVDGHPLLEIQLTRLYNLGVRDIVVNVHHFADIIIKYLESYHCPELTIHISNEKDHLLDTGGGLRKAAFTYYNTLNAKPVLIHNVDILDNADLVSMYNQCDNTTDAIVLVSKRQTQRYLLFDKELSLVGWTNTTTGEIKTPYEKLDISQCYKLAFSGIHVVGPCIFKEMETYPDEFRIIDFYLNSCKKLKIKGVIQPGLRLLDVGKIDTLAMASDFLKSLQ